VSGCLWEPEIEDSWTRLDVIEPASPAAVAGGAVQIRSRITYREIMTGDVIAELRVSDVVTHDAVQLGPTADREALLEDVELILNNSQRLGAAAVPVTGWTHLMQEFTLELDASGIPSDPAQGYAFIVVYFGQSETVELPDGTEITTFEPGDFRETHVLPAGVELVRFAGDQP
jgi:hypothetical protein